MIVAGMTMEVSVKVSVLFVAGLVAAAGSATARAGEGEGNGDPFPFHAQPLVTTTTGVVLSPLLNQNPYGYSTKGQLLTQGQLAQAPVTGSQGEPEPLNALPPGAEDTPTMLAHDPAVHRGRFASHTNVATHG